MFWDSVLWTCWKAAVRIMCWELPSVGPGEVPEVGAILWNSSEICLQGWYHWIWLRVSTTWAVTIECCLTKARQEHHWNQKDRLHPLSVPSADRAKIQPADKGRMFQYLNQGSEGGFGAESKWTDNWHSYPGGWVRDSLIGNLPTSSFSLFLLSLPPIPESSLALIYHVWIVFYGFFCLFMFKLNLVFFPVTLRASLLRLKSLKLITLFSIFCCQPFPYATPQNCLPHWMKVGEGAQGHMMGK